MSVIDRTSTVRLVTPSLILAPSVVDSRLDAMRMAVGFASPTDAEARHLGFEIVEDVRAHCKALMASRDAWKAYAAHRDTCEACGYEDDLHGDTGTLSLCDVGARLRDAARAGDTP